MSQFHATILTLFPGMFPGSLGYSLAGKALKNGIWSYDIVNIRDFGLTRHKKVDDEPCGGGNGLVLRPDVLGPALDKALADADKAGFAREKVKIYYPSPRGRLFTQRQAHEMSRERRIIILCGRFEGVDERIIDEYNAEQVSVGDYILSGGEMAASVILDSIIRLLPGVLENQNTLKDESFERGAGNKKLLEYPLYTKPALWRGRRVPEVLLSGNHKEVAKWREEKSLQITQELRPDLLK